MHILNIQITHGKLQLRRSASGKKNLTINHKRELKEISEYSTAEFVCFNVGHHSKGKKRH